MDERSPEYWEAKIEEIRARKIRRYEQQLDPSDCALSSRCDDLTMAEYQTKARVARAGWKDTFPALFNLEGQRVRAKLISGQWGLCWAMVGPDGQFTGKFVGAFPARASTMRRKGFVEGEEEAPADVCIASSGTGMAGLCSASVNIYRADAGYPANAVDA